MEIIANGIDLVDFPRIEELTERHGRRFLDRVFTAAEQKYADSNKNRIEKLAGRFAAKEAIVKLIGTGWRSVGLVTFAAVGISAGSAHRLTDGAGEERAVSIPHCVTTEGIDRTHDTAAGRVFAAR